MPSRMRLPSTVSEFETVVLRPNVSVGGMLHAVQNAKSLDAAPVEVIAFFSDWVIAEANNATRQYKNPAPAR